MPRLIGIMDRQITWIARPAADLTDVTRIDHGALRQCVSRIDLVDVLTEIAGRHRVGDPCGARAG